MYFWRRVTFLGHFVLPNRWKFSFSMILSNSSHWIHTNLALHAHWGYFYRCVEYGPHGSDYWVVWGPEICGNSRFVSFFQNVSPVSHHFGAKEVTKSSLQSFPKIKSTGLTSTWFACQFEQLLEVCLISASEAWFLGDFVPHDKIKILVFCHFLQNIPSLFTCPFWVRFRCSSIMW